jgi:hypothetical protein
MGQYYLIVNLDKKEYLRPHAFGDGAKLLEFGASANGAMTGLSILLADGNGRGGGDLHSKNPIIGSWAGDRIVITGDYADPNLFGIKTGKKPITVKVGRRKDKTWTVTPENQNLYTLISLDELFAKKINGGLERKWKDISKKVIKAMKDDSFLKNELKKKMEWMK